MNQEQLIYHEMEVTAAKELKKIHDSQFDPWQQTLFPPVSYLTATAGVVLGPVTASAFGPIDFGTAALASLAGGLVEFQLRLSGIQRRLRQQHTDNFSDFVKSELHGVDPTTL